MFISRAPLKRHWAFESHASFELHRDAALPLKQGLQRDDLKITSLKGYRGREGSLTTGVRHSFNVSTNSDSESEKRTNRQQRRIIVPGRAERVHQGHYTIVNI